MNNTTDENSFGNLLVLIIFTVALYFKHIFPTHQHVHLYGMEGKQIVVTEQFCNNS